MAPDDTDVTDTDGQLIAPIIPLRREPAGPVLTVLADEPAPPRQEPERGPEASERSIWDHNPDVLPRRDPTHARPTTPPRTRRRVRTTRWLSLTAGALTAAAVTTLALLGGAIPGLSSNTPHAVRAPALHASSPSAPAGRVGHPTAPSHRPSTSTALRRSAQPSRVTRVINGAARPATSPGATTDATAIPAPTEHASTPSTGSPAQPVAAASATHEFGFEKQ